MKHWKSIVALAILPFALHFNWTNFYFAILFLIWSIQGIRDKTTSLLDDISVEESPVLFWIVTIAWLVLSLWSLLYSDTVLTWLYDAFGIYWNYGN